MKKNEMDLKFSIANGDGVGRFHTVVRGKIILFAHCVCFPVVMAIGIPKGVGTFDEHTRQLYSEEVKETTNASKTYCRFSDLVRDEFDRTNCSEEYSSNVSWVVQTVFPLRPRPHLGIVNDIDCKRTILMGIMRKWRISAPALKELEQEFRWTEPWQTTNLQEYVELKGRGWRIVQDIRCFNAYKPEYREDLIYHFSQPARSYVESLPEGERAKAVSNFVVRAGLTNDEARRFWVLPIPSRDKWLQEGWGVVR